MEQQAPKQFDHMVHKAGPDGRTMSVNEYKLTIHEGRYFYFRGGKFFTAGADEIPLDQVPDAIIKNYGLQKEKAIAMVRAEGMQKKQAEAEAKEQERLRQEAEAFLAEARAVVANEGKKQEAPQQASNPLDDLDAGLGSNPLGDSPPEMELALKQKPNKNKRS